MVVLAAALYHLCHYNCDYVSLFCYRILNECDVQLYRQMGGVRDDLNIHEKALNILIELLKKEQVCT